MSCEYPRYEKGVMIMCRKCIKCLQRRETDIVGRCMAEALVSDSHAALTLTYENSFDVRSKTLAYRDIQLLLKRVRKHGYDNGYSVRYIVAGEYGSKRGRSHWHIVLFFRGGAPTLPAVDMEKQHWSFWSEDGKPMGFVFHQQPDFFGLRYVVGYTIKDLGSDKSDRSVMMSKKPPLGADYWHVMARTLVDAGQPFSRLYTLPNCHYKNGNDVKFILSDRSLQLAYSAYSKYWRTLNSGLPPVKVETLKSLEKVLMLGIARSATLSSRASLNEMLGTRDFKLVDRAIPIPVGFLVLLKTGVLYAVQEVKGKVFRWPVRSVAEALELARGYRVRGRASLAAVRKVIGLRVPF